jgi:hypothetical protein
VTGKCGILKNAGVMQLAVICVALCPWSVAAQPVPEGYQMTRAGKVLVFRPVGEADAAIAIKVMPAMPSGDPSDALAAWAAANPPPGIIVQALQPAQRISEDVAVSGRMYKLKERIFMEGIIAGRATKGAVQMQVTTVPFDRKEILTDMSKAAGTITRAMITGAYVKVLPMTTVAVAPKQKQAAPGQLASGGGAAAASGAQKQIAQIQTVGFYSKTGIGYGGMVTFNPTPVVLFKNGEALKDIEALAGSGDIARHRRSNPGDWTRWQRTGGTIQLLKDGVWEKLPWTKTMDKLPAGFKLRGKYQKLGGGGNTAMGGMTAIAVWSDLTFDTAGNFTSGGGAGASSGMELDGGDTTVRTVTSSQAASNNGRYEIDGYTLTLRYGSGKVERRMIVTDTESLKVIWLDGDGYTQRGS